MSQSVKALFPIVFSLLISACGKDDPVFRVNLAEKDAFTLAAYILSSARLRGCGEFDITGQMPFLHEIRVLCKGGDRATEHTLQYYPELKADYRSIVDNPWDRPWLADAFCVKRPNGDWDLAFISIDDARARAEEISREANLPTQIYSASQNLYWQTFKSENDKWTVNVPRGEAEEDDDRVGCQF